MIGTLLYFGGGGGRGGGVVHVNVILNVQEMYIPLTPIPKKKLFAIDTICRQLTETGRPKYLTEGTLLRCIYFVRKVLKVILPTDGVGGGGGGGYCINN